MNHDELKSLLALAALERLETDEEAGLRAHLAAGCSECEAELRELREAAAALAVSSYAPTSRVASKIEARLAVAERIKDRGPGYRVSPETRRSTDRRAARLGLAAALVLAAYGVAVTLRLFGLEHSYRNHLASLERRFNTLQAQAQSASEKVDEFSKVLAEHIELDHVLESPDRQILQLVPRGPTREARAIVAVSRQLRLAVIQANGLPITREDNTYELWWITQESGPVPAGAFRTQPGAEVIEQVVPPPFEKHVIMGEVTLEPAGGIKKLMGAVYLQGSFQQNPMNERK